MPIFKAVVLVALVLFGASGRSAEIVRVAVRGGESQSFLLFNQGEQPRAIAILLPGGDGLLRLRGGGNAVCQGNEEGDTCIQLDLRGNFLIRTVGMLRDRDVAAALMDAPSDHQRLGLTPAARLSPEHALDVGAVAGWLRARFPQAKLFLVGTSAGTLSAAYAGRALGEAIDGIILTAAVMNASHRWYAMGGFYGLGKFDFGELKRPILMVHHVDDQCLLCPFSEARTTAERHRIPLVAISGGLPPRSQPCDALSQHGFLGKEREAVEAMKHWMLKQAGNP